MHHYSLIHYMQFKYQFQYHSAIICSAFCNFQSHWIKYVQWIRYFIISFVHCSDAEKWFILLGDLFFPLMKVKMITTRNIIRYKRYTKRETISMTPYPSLWQKQRALKLIISCSYCFQLIRSRFIFELVAVVVYVLVSVLFSFNVLFLFFFVLTVRLCVSQIYEFG